MKDLIENTEFICFALTIIAVMFAISIIYIIGLIRLLIFKIKDIQAMLEDISSDTDVIRNHAN